MKLRPPRSTRTDTLFPYAPLCRSHARSAAGRAGEGAVERARRPRRRSARHPDPRHRPEGRDRRAVRAAQSARRRRSEFPAVGRSGRRFQADDPAHAAGRARRHLGHDRRACYRPPGRGARRRRAARPHPRRARRTDRRQGPDRRSEEHTSELQSLMRISYAAFCLKKKKTQKKEKKERLITTNQTYIDIRMQKEQESKKQT